MRVQAALPLWRGITNNTSVLRYLASGYHPHFLTDIPPFFHRSSKVTDPVIQSFLEEDLQLQIQNHQLLEVFPDPGSLPTFCSSARVIPKPNQPNKFRLIVDYRFVNSHIQHQRFRCQDLSSLQHLLRPGDFLVVLDLQDGYRHIPIHPNAQPFLTFNIMGRFFTPLALNFGLTSAPRVFTKCITTVVAHLRSQGVRVSAYLDDFIIAASSHQAALAARDQVISCLQALGLSVHPSKGVWEPSQRAVYLGLEVDCSGTVPVFRIPPDKQQQVRERASSLLARASQRSPEPSLPLRSLQSFCGLTNFLSRALRCARLYNREFFNCMKLHAQCRRPRGGGRPFFPPHQPIPLSAQALQDLQWWQSTELLSSAERPVHPPSMTLAARLTTDASTEGWGCLLGDQVTGADRWGPSTAHRHINAKELQAVELALRLHLPQLQGRRVLLLSDNTTVCHILNTGTTRSQDLLPDLRRVWELLLDHNIDLHPRYIPTDENPADAPSRKVDAYGQQLRPDLFQALQQRWGPYTIDRFADSANTQLPLFHSFHPSPVAAGTPDAFTNSWAKGNSWMYPPFPLVGRALQHLRETRGRGTLVAPAWPGQPWWPLLTEAATETIDLNRWWGEEDPALLHVGENTNNNWFCTHPPQEGPPHHTWHLMAFSLDFRHQN